jgi:phosphoribosyl-ATP pyrophosphohydrolase/phosphoribosyl-AMP cyclohydrolase
MRDRNAALTGADLPSLAWDKMGGLIPAIVQDSGTRAVLMVGYMNPEALQATLDTGFATFYSRSKGRLWQKGETSGDRLVVRAVFADCDEDALLVEAKPEGPTCHLGTTSCFGEGEGEGVAFLARLAEIVRERAASGGSGSYTAKLLAEGPVRIAQKVGEEGVEVALAAATGDREGCIGETADLIYHLTVLMEATGFTWEDIAARLRERHSG